MNSISIVIRTFNEDSRLDKVINAIEDQINASLSEIIIVDSGSTDATLNVARAHNCKIVKIYPEDFSFGRALNVGAKASSSEIVVFLSPDCLPKSKRWLSYLVSPLIQDEIAAVFGRQIPFEGVNPYEEVILANSYPVNAESDGSSPVSKCAFSNANCAIKRKFLIEAPFDVNIVAGEERSIVNHILANGYRIIYEPRAEVYHSHSIERLYLKAYITSYSACQEPSGTHFDSLGYLIAHCFLWMFRDSVYFIRIHNASVLLRAPIHEFVTHFYLWKESSDHRLKKPLHFDPRLYMRIGFIIERPTGRHSPIPLH